MRRPLLFKIVVLLAIVQATFGVLRAYDWMKIGTDLFAQGLLLLPAVGVVAFLRGMFIAVVAGLYLLFVVGALLRVQWARPAGIAAIVINLVLVANASLHGAPLAQATIWVVIPAILLIYLFSPAWRYALKSSAEFDERRS